MIRQTALRLPLAAAAIAGGLCIDLANPLAGEVSAQQIRDQLKSSVTRSLSGNRAAISPDELATLKRISRSRSLSSGDREQIAAIAANRPTIDLEINFDYNSAALAPQAEPQLKSLGDALTSEELQGAVVMLGGHTDAQGGNSYNQSLSERRAEAVKRYLTEHYHLSADRLIAVGYGKTRLKDPADPLGAENRRVQIVNLAERDQATK